MGVLIDGTTGEIIGPIPRSARQAKPTFQGTTTPSTALVRTRVIRRYRGFREPEKITNRNQPSGPSGDQYAALLAALEKGARQVNRHMKKQNPVLGAIADVLLDQFAKQRKPPKR